MLSHFSTLARLNTAFLVAGGMFAIVQPVFAVVHTRTTVDIPMRDTQTLKADIYTPPGEGPWPAILIQTPYNKNQFILTFTTEISQNPLFKSPDYAFVVADWRGFFGSADAAYQGSPTRGEDGYDTVEWVAAQDWCTGNVGTWGLSALGMIQLQTALEKPPSLKASVPMVCRQGDTYERWFPGGVYFENRNDFIEEYFGAGDLYKSHPYKDTFWSFVESLRQDYSGVTTPMLFITGWYDHETKETIIEYESVRAGRTDQSTWLMSGPWSHGAIGQADQAERSYPDTEFADSIAALRFMDYYLRGIDNGWQNTPAVQFYQMNDARWNTAPDWPPANTVDTVYHLSSSGSLERDTVAVSSGTITYTSDPNDPVPTLFGALLQEDNGTQGPGDIRQLVDRDDTVLFTTAPLSKPLPIAGIPTATIWLEADAPDVDVSVRLVEVLPDGTVYTIVDGIHRASLRESFETPSFLEPGVPVRVNVEIAPVAVTIPEGNRLGLLVASSNYDLYDMNPQDGSSFRDEPDASPQVADVTLLIGPEHGSQLVVPVLTAGMADMWLIN